MGQYTVQSTSWSPHPVSHNAIHQTIESSWFRAHVPSGMQGSASTCSSRMPAGRGPSASALSAALLPPGAAAAGWLGQRDTTSGWSEMAALRRSCCSHALWWQQQQQFPGGVVGAFIFFMGKVGCAISSIGHLVVLQLSSHYWVVNFLVHSLRVLALWLVATAWWSWCSSLWSGRMPPSLGAAVFGTRPNGNPGLQGVGAARLEVPLAAALALAELRSLASLVAASLVPVLCWRCSQYFVLYIIYVVAPRVGSGLIHRGTSVRLWCFLRSAGFTIMYSRSSWRRGTLRSGLLRVAAVHHCGHGCSRRGQRTIPLQLGRASGGERGKAPLRRKLKF